MVKERQLVATGVSPAARPSSLMPTPFANKISYQARVDESCTSRGLFKSNVVKTRLHITITATLTTAESSAISRLAKKKENKRDERRVSGGRRRETERREREKDRGRRLVNQTPLLVDQRLQLRLHASLSESVPCSLIHTMVLGVDKEIRHLLGSEW